MNTTLDTYRSHLLVTGDWLLKSFRPKQGGSSAHASPVLGWSDAYPETTGYIIPTLLEMARRLDLAEAQAAALDAARWLITIQAPDGYWVGGLHPPRKNAQASVFNTGQILLGLVAAYEQTENPQFIDAALKAGEWLAAGVDPDGIWQTGHYQSGYQPSYYAHVTWPMLEVWRVSGEQKIRDAAERVLTGILDRRRDNGAFDAWSFKSGDPAFTHTIAYTLYGLQRSAQMVDDWPTYGAPAQQALDILWRRSELSGGRLPGTFDGQWNADRSFVCVTGCSQVALCLLESDRQQPDLALVNAAAKLCDFVCSSQYTLGPALIKGAVPGSVPIWGKYMRMRYPNWAAKFHCDALMQLMDRLNAERNV